MLASNSSSVVSLECTVCRAHLLPHCKHMRRWGGHGGGGVSSSKERLLTHQRKGTASWPAAMAVRC
jgi:hypothetical protein